MDIEKERELFENFISNTWLSDADWNENCNTYKESSIHMMWTSWIASRNREGCVLVPVDTLNRTVGHIAIALCHPNNSKNEEDVMHKDLKIIEKAMIGACDD